jgi:serine/threonine protein kinase
MIIGSLPFEGENTHEVLKAKLIQHPRPLRDIDPEIPPEIEEIVLHALERDPSERYISAAAMESELESPETVTLTGRSRNRQTYKNRKRQFKRVGFVLLVSAAPIVCFYLFLLMFRARP